MFDYRLDDEKNTNLEYIINYRINRSNPNEILVKFADMDEPLVIDNSYENIEKLDQIMEEQMLRAIENRKKIKRLNNTKISGRISSFIVGLILSNSNILNENSAKFLAYCTFVLGLPILSEIVLPNYSEQIKEIDKARFLLENIDLLMAYEEYCKPLRGVSNKCRRYLRRSDDPFKINDLDSFSIDDLKKMVHNMRKEENFGFSYTKKYR